MQYLDLLNKDKTNELNKIETIMKQADSLR